MYKILNSLSPKIKKDIFKTKTNYYNTRNAFQKNSKRNVPKEMLKHIDIEYRPDLIWVLRFGTLFPKR